VTSLPAVADTAWRDRVERFADSLVPVALQPRREQVQYLVVGAWNTAFGYAVWATLQYLLHDRVDYWLIVVASYPIAVANAYLTYRYIVFRSHGPILRELPRFSIVYLLTLIANLIALPVLLSVLPFSIYIIQAVFLAGVVVASYLGHRYFSFGYRGQRPDTGPREPSDEPIGSSDVSGER